MLESYVRTLVLEMKPQFRDTTAVVELFRRLKATIATMKKRGASKHETLSSFYDELKAGIRKIVADSHGDAISIVFKVNPDPGGWYIRGAEIEPLGMHKFRVTLALSTKMISRLVFDNPNLSETKLGWRRFENEMRGKIGHEIGVHVHQIDRGDRPPTIPASEQLGLEASPDAAYLMNSQEIAAWAHDIATEIRDAGFTFVNTETLENSETYRMWLETLSDKNVSRHYRNRFERARKKLLLYVNHFLRS